MRRLAGAALLAALVTLAPARAAAPVLDCPPGTKLAGGGPPEQYEAWCEGRPDSYGKARRHGPARTWYDDGAPWVSDTWFEGLRDGPSLEQHRNGRKAREGTWRRDEKAGTWTLWYESGQVEEVSTWDRNVLHGPFAAWFPNGTQRTEGRYCRGAQCGTWRTWDEGGRLLGTGEFGERSDRP